MRLFHINGDLQMKKSLIALAALATVATAAQAQSSVTVYGLLDAGVRSQSSGVAASTSDKQLTKAVSGVLNTSRFGLRGTEDLGGGLKANFNTEGKIDLTNGGQSTNLFDRRAIVGLEQTGVGRVDLGRNTTLGYDLTAAYVNDPLGQEVTVTQGTARQAMAANPLGYIYGDANATVRRDNAIKYSGTFGATSVGLMYAVGGTAGDTQKNSSIQALARYNANGLDVGFAYDDVTDAAKKHQITWTTGGNYTFNALKATVGYTDVKVDANFVGGTAGGGVSAVSATAAASYTGMLSSNSANLTAKVWNGGLTYQASSALNVVAAYYNTTFAGNGVAGYKLDSYLLRARYALSKRTDLYGLVDYTTSKGLAAASTINGGATTNTGITAGVQHRF